MNVGVGILFLAVLIQHLLPSVRRRHAAARRHERQRRRAGPREAHQLLHCCAIVVTAKQPTTQRRQVRGRHSRHRDTAPVSCRQPSGWGCRLQVAPKLKARFLWELWGPMCVPHFLRHSVCVVELEIWCEPQNNATNVYFRCLRRGIGFFEYGVSFLQPISMAFCSPNIVRKSPLAIRGLTISIPKCYIVQIGTTPVNRSHSPVFCLCDTVNRGISSGGILSRELCPGFAQRRPLLRCIVHGTHVSYVVSVLYLPIFSTTRNDGSRPRKQRRLTYASCL